MRLQHKRALVTAAASGIGRAGCELFAREGATVFAVDIDAARLDELISAIQRAGGQAHGAVADLLDPAACARVVDDAARVMGGLDIVWNHVGVTSGRGIKGIALDDYARCMDLNVRTGMLVTAAALPHLRASGGGSVVFSASIAGVVGMVSSPVYSAAKAAVIGMARSLSLRCARDRIRVNAICPGPIDTPMLQAFLGTAGDAAAQAVARERAIASVPMRRAGLPIEVAHPALWLASDDASYVTGVALPADSGYSVP